MTMEQLTAVIRFAKAMDDAEMLATAERMIDLMAQRGNITDEDAASLYLIIKGEVNANT